MKYILQIFSGFWNTLNYSAEDVISRIDSLASGIEIDKESRMPILPLLPSPPAW